jgi:hypothetical protein
MNDAIYLDALLKLFMAQLWGWDGAPRESICNSGYYKLDPNWRKSVK